MGEDPPDHRITDNYQYYYVYKGDTLMTIDTSDPSGKDVNISTGDPVIPVIPPLSSPRQSLDILQMLERIKTGAPPPMDGATRPSVKVGEVYEERTYRGSPGVSIYAPPGNVDLMTGMSCRKILMDFIVDPETQISTHIHALSGNALLVIDLAKASDDLVKDLLSKLADKKIIIHDLKTLYGPLVKRLGARILPASYVDTYIFAKMLHYSEFHEEMKAGDATCDRVWRDMLKMSEENRASPTPGTNEHIAYIVQRLRRIETLQDRLAYRASSLWGSLDPFSIENEFVNELIRIEAVGIPVNRAALEAEAAALRPSFTDLREYFAKCTINPDSRDDVYGYAKTQKLKLESLKTEAIAKHASDPVLGRIPEYRQVKNKLDFLEGVLKQGSDRIHTHFEQISSRNGRMSASNPNVQGIRKEIKKVFYGAPAGRTLLSIDFPASHLRILAEMSGDAAMIQAFKDGINPHMMTASALFKKDIREITPEQRNLGKTVNHGVTNCMGPDTLREYANQRYSLNITKKEAKAFLASMEKSRPGVTEWKGKLEEKLSSSKESHPFGDRIIPVTTASGRVVKAIGLPEAVNYPLAGTEAEILKIAATAFGKECREQGIDAQIVNLVHDSIVVEAASDEKERASAVLKNITESAFRRMVPSFHTEITVEEL